MEQSVFEHTDDVSGDKYLDVWTSGTGDLYVLIHNPETLENMTVFIRDGEALGKAILKAMWS